MSTRTIHWTEDTKTMKIRTDIPKFFIEFGNQMVYRIKNNTGANLNIGSVVFFSGSDTFPTVTIADYTDYATSEGTLGLCAHDIPNNTEGYVITSGILRNVPLVNYENGEEIYLGENGSFINTRPVSPLPEVYLGTVIKNGESGILSVNIELGLELNELHDVKIDNPQDKQILTYNSYLGVWEAKFFSAENIENPVYDRRTDYASPYQYSGNAPIGTLDNENWIIRRIDFSQDPPLILSSVGPWDDRITLSYS
jgi:hypothetical protein